MDFDGNISDKPGSKGTGSLWSNSSSKDNHHLKCELVYSSFRDFLLKSELLCALKECGFDHPSRVQDVTLPKTISEGRDLICQARSGMGKTAVFVLTILQKIITNDPSCVQALVICHTRELAYQISNEFIRFSKYLKHVKTAAFYGGIPISLNEQQLKSETPNIVVATPGRLKSLIRNKFLKVGNVQFFVIDEVDKVFENDGMRKDVNEIFSSTPKEKQVMMLSATLCEQMLNLCRKLANKSVFEVLVENEKKLSLFGVKQYYVELVTDDQKRVKLCKLLDDLEYNQVVVFVRTRQRAENLNLILNQRGYPTICIHGKLAQTDRIERYNQFKLFQKRIMVSTDLIGRGIDIKRVNIIVNYDMPFTSDTYLHRTGRTGRFGTKGLAVSFLQKGKSHNFGDHSEMTSDLDVLMDVQKRFMKDGKIEVLPKNIDTSTYMN